MDNQPLHPNLARLAASYDDILRRYSVRQIDVATARLEMLALQARDDEGRIWTLDPDNGAWKYRTRTGQWVAADPPRSGLATLTAHDLSRDPRLFNPDSRIRYEEAPVVTHGLHGAVRGKVGQPTVASAGEGRRGVRLAAAAIVAAVVAVAAFAMTRPDDPPPSFEPVPTSEPGCLGCLTD